MAGTGNFNDLSRTGVPDHKAPPRCGFIAILGAPNAGKSTLVNALVGSKVAIVTHKAQTTRSLTRGIAVEGDSQLIFMDTPGIFAPKRRLDRAMVAGAWGVAQDADLVALLIDAQRGLDEEARAILERLAPLRQPEPLGLNKVDVVPKPRLLGLSAQLNGAAAFETTFMLSALPGGGVADPKPLLHARVPPSP